tara:strand:+ start:111 stop:416 length:306 start_codon:yes stop_codon:yes gene_type:complete
MAQLTDNELKMMDALAGVMDYVMETSSEMEEDDMMLCNKCKNITGIKITLENEYYAEGLQHAMDVFHEMENKYGDEFRAHQQALGQMSDIKHGRRKITAES